ncbi:response regulator transcription factor [Streptomonospora sp. PA3]|uniref:response regulator transcription factor n=1 Tax=Streptomonospora sp. PA3 TaxID=2607326 RepID=UPI002108468D|nr:response regulator transcription factor [Streptomonospora sp. PA3]
MLVEHQEDDAERLLAVLRRHGYTVDTVDTGHQALERYRSADMVILELDLPDLDGLKVCRTIRAESDIPIIVVTDRGTELDRVLGLQSGADDYIVKPCQLHETLARIDAVLRRTRSPEQRSSNIFRGPLQLEAASREVLLDGTAVRLTRKEFDLLHILASEPGKVFSRQELMKQVWGGSWSRRTLDTHVSSIRRKLGPGEWIITVRGVGFQFATT